MSAFCVVEVVVMVNDPVTQLFPQPNVDWFWAKAKVLSRKKMIEIRIY